MRFDLTDDQTVLRDTTDRFLTDVVPVDELRRRRHDPVGFDPGYWRRGAELGWVSLLVSEAHGGGSISGDGLADLTLVADAFGRHAAPGPLVSTNIVAACLSRASGNAGHAEVIAALVSGEAIAPWAYGEPRPNDGLGTIALEISVDGDEVVLNGVKRPVESGAQASWFLVTGRSGGGLTQVVVPADAAGITISPLESVDLTRRFSTVVFDGVRLPIDQVVGAVGGAAADVGLAAARRVGAEQRGGGRCHAIRVRPHRRMGLRSLLVRASAGLVPGAATPFRRHEDVVGGQPRHR